MQFSLLSSKAKCLAKCSRRHIGLLEWSFGKQYRIRLRNRADDDDMSPQRSIKVPSYRSVPRISFKLNQKLVPSDRCRFHLSFGEAHMEEAEKEKLFKEVNDYMLEIFKIDAFQLSDNIYRCKQFVLKYTKTLKGLVMASEEIPPDFSTILEEFGVEELTVYSNPSLEIRRKVCFYTPLKLKV